MAIRTEVPVTIHSRNNRELSPTTSNICRVEWNHQERLKRALRILIILLVATFISVFIPILHFFLVPVLLISSFVVAIDQWNEKHHNEGGTAPCPKCEKSFTIQPSKWSSRITNHCDHCHEDLEILI